MVYYLSYLEIILFIILCFYIFYKNNIFYYFLLKIYDYKNGVLYKNFILIFKPFQKIFSCKVEFFLWALFTLVAGQLGIINNIIIRFYGTNTSIINSIYLDSLAGNFYLYSIAIVASMLGTIFTVFLVKEENKFTYIRVITSSLLIFFIIVVSVIYSATQLYSTQNPSNENLEFDYSQFISYILAIILSIYCFGILKLKYPNDKDISDPEYYKAETNDVDDLRREAANIDIKEGVIYDE
ncbi:hypothetical protein ACG91D_02180 [Acinetobacter guillouiae]|uniref:hypothetical protein n=1 Tax=Acinetobacter guillouiae TaxID=106649 RepID=UPI003AF4F293